MQTIEKALHTPMPFTAGGQTINDRLTAAKHSLAGSQLGKSICKATTEEYIGPKKKHLDCESRTACARNPAPPRPAPFSAPVFCSRFTRWTRSRRLHLEQNRSGHVHIIIALFPSTFRSHSPSVRSK